MNYKELVEKIVDKGIKAVKRDYKRLDQKSILKGSIAGFKACLDKSPMELKVLLGIVNTKSLKYLRTTNLSTKASNKYRELRGFALEVRWVCNVVSCVLYNEGKPVIISPTARGMITAGDIVGVGKMTNTKGSMEKKVRKILATTYAHGYDDCKTGLKLSHVTEKHREKCDVPVDELLNLLKDQRTKDIEKLRGLKKKVWQPLSDSNQREKKIIKFKLSELDKRDNKFIDQAISTLKGEE